MLSREDIDHLFSACREGTLSASALNSIDDICSIRNNERQSLMEVAIRCKSREMMELLMRHGFNALYSHELMVAAETGRCDIFRIILENMADDVREEDLLCEEALWPACYGGYADIVSCILSYDPTIVSGHHVVYACSCEHPEIVRQLLDSAHASGREIEFSYGAGGKLEGGLDTPIVEVLRCFRSDAPDEIKDQMLAMIMELEDCREDLVLGATNFFFWMCVGELGTAAFAERLADTYSREKAKAIEADPAMATGEDSKFDDFKIEHALNTACEHGNIGVAKYLLEYLKSMRPLEQYYKGRLTVAGEVRNKEIFRLVLSSFNIDVNDPSPGFDLGFVLYHAAACGCEDVVAALLANPACGPSQINSLHQNYSFMGTPLSAASDVEVIKMLLDSKADVNPVGGVSVFAASAESYHIEAVRLLCEAGASAAYGDVAERQGYTLTETVLSAASCGGNSESHQTVIKLLLKAGLRTRGLSKGSTALTACCAQFVKNPVPLMRALLAHDPGLLEATDGSGETPLVVASRRSSPSGKLFLLRAGADPAACDGDGRTALHMLWEAYSRVVWRDEGRNSDKAINQAILGMIDAVLARAQPAVGAVTVSDDGDARDELEQTRKRQRTEDA